MFRTVTNEVERLIPLGFAVSAAERVLTLAAAELTLARWRD